MIGASFPQYRHQSKEAEVNKTPPADLTPIAQHTSQWAENHVLIRRLWIYGSRAKGTNRPDSDLDVAFELDPLPYGTARDQFHDEKARWKAELSGALGLEVHLEPILQAQLSVREHGVLIYERSGAPPCKVLAD
jgi:predicted nucleotidyltransferase